MIPRNLRPTAILPIKIQSAHTLSMGCTLDISRTGIKVQIDADLAPGEHVTVLHGLRKMPFRVVWTKQERNTFLAGLVSLEQPLNWGQMPGAFEEHS